MGATLTPATDGAALTAHAATPPQAGGALSPAELSAWKGLVKAHAALVKRLDSELEATHGLPLSHYEVLVALEQAPSSRMRPELGFSTPVRRLMTVVLPAPFGPISA